MDTQTDSFADNWGRWGPNDELGTLNFVTEAVRQRAAQAARSGRSVSLAIPQHPAPMAGPMPFLPGTSPGATQQLMLFTGSPPAALADVLFVNTHHVGLTHIDSLGHIPLDGKVYPGIPLAEVMGGAGLRHGSTAAFAGGIITRGVLLDLAFAERLPESHPVTASDLDAAEKRGGTSIESGDAVLIRGGWAVRNAEAELLPWISRDAVEWLALREVSILASDIGDKPPRTPGAEMNLHQLALARLGMPLIDGADLEELAKVVQEESRTCFLLVVAPIPIHGATGSPVNPIAIF